MSQELIDAICNMREKDALDIATAMLDSGTSALDVLAAGRQGLEAVGERFEKGEAFVPELFLAGEMLKQISEKAKPLLKGLAETAGSSGKVVLGTVKGDIHNIGKDIVTFMLDAAGFEVLDLGVDVPPAEFVRAVKGFEPQVVGLSGFLTLAYEPMKATVEALREAGLPVKVMIGGGQVDDQIRQHTGADAYGRDAVAAVSLCKQWVAG